MTDILTFLFFKIQNSQHCCTNNVLKYYLLKNTCVTNCEVLNSLFFVNVVKQI